MKYVHLLLSIIPVDKFVLIHSDRALMMLLLNNNNLITETMNVKGEGARELNKNGVVVGEKYNYTLIELSINIKENMNRILWCWKAGYLFIVGRRPR